jgi:hypothetical protein
MITANNGIAGVDCIKSDNRVFDKIDGAITAIAR